MKFTKHDKNEELEAHVLLYPELYEDDEFEDDRTFDFNDQQEAKAFIKGYKEAVNDIDLNNLLQVLKDSILTIKWYMDNTGCDNPESFYNIGMTQRSEIENIINQIEL